LESENTCENLLKKNTSIQQENINLQEKINDAEIIIDKLDKDNVNSRVKSQSIQQQLEQYQSNTEKKLSSQKNRSNSRDRDNQQYIIKVNESNHSTPKS